MTWLSIIPPCVGSGCRQTSVATGSLFSGSASSPTRVRPSAVLSCNGSRRAGSTELARIAGIAWKPSRAGSPPRRGPRVLPHPNGLPEIIAPRWMRVVTLPAPRVQARRAIPSPLALGLSRRRTLAGPPVAIANPRAKLPASYFASQ